MKNFHFYNFFYYYENQTIRLKCESLLNRLRNSLIKTRHKLNNEIVKLFKNKKNDVYLLKYIEEQLIMADVGVDTTRKIIATLQNYTIDFKENNAKFLYEKLRQEMTSILFKVNKPLVLKNKSPFVILVVGVNGVGKTTTIGKLSYRYKLEGKKVMLSAGDTFRAAAIEQLQMWGLYNQVTVIAQQAGADTSAVIFDSIQAAKSRQIDVLIIDTAGRLQNKSYLIKELKKNIKTMKKIDPEAPHEIILIIDASIGQNSIYQVTEFHKFIGITGIIITKLDGTAKGGVIFSIANKFKIPIRYIGIGEGIEDLQEFNVQHFVEALFSKDNF
ncbi:signal recognition particle-docking protein FtsY [Blochmannia endosymbiont of Camponotus (Colobopsis) obliquus]|uniref:signal recognition particle-docking protein FtsY n=1 Tax=Blochmannia endosymbiont of Camponotus (Colobopsis) obliquus TaxID=1505597 RepID=UPI00061A7488|nr:signal recognition particle-docking protein FtsY [Blochmannia endosymbiont of Camponotus (Colobopsis) obliquus]AKC60767.1 Signal recognition particle receptor FtsY [Blochmannia endosymbiont of Camponotus (Colobopsis) obliquus]